MDNQVRTFEQWLTHVEQLETQNNHREHLIALLQKTITRLVDMNREAINAEILYVYGDPNLGGSPVINAIKRARELTGLGLRESKDYVEELIASL